MTRDKYERARADELESAFRRLAGDARERANWKRGQIKKLEEEIASCEAEIVALQFLLDTHCDTSLRA